MLVMLYLQDEPVTSEDSSDKDQEANPGTLEERPAEGFANPVSI